MKTRLKRMQYRPALLDGFLASTGLDLTALTRCWRVLIAVGPWERYIISRPFALLITARSASSKMPGCARGSSISVLAPLFGPDGEAPGGRPA